MDTSFKKRFIPVAILAVCFFVVPALPGVCCDNDDRDKDPNIGHLILCEKTLDINDPFSTGLNVPCDPSGKAWGKLKYKKSGPTFDYVFNGHGLIPGQTYTLIYFPDPWPGFGLIHLGSDTARGRGGEVHIEGSLDTGDLPVSFDDNFPNGAKIWLVLSSDLCFRSRYGGLMLYWHPDQYLFEKNLILFDDLHTYHEVCEPS